MGKLHRIDDHLTDRRITILEQSIIHIGEGIMRIEGKVDSGFAHAESRTDRMNDRAWSNFLWLLGTMLTLASAGAGVMAKGFGWL